MKTELRNTFKITKETAPSHWASYLINGDSSSLTIQELEVIHRWQQHRGYVVGCEDAGFIWHHDAFAYCPFGADCQTYSFIE